MKYAVCEEIFDNILNGCYTIRTAQDTNPNRFMVHGYFDTYEEAYNFIKTLKEKGK